MPITFVGVEITERQQRERLSIAVTRGSAAQTSLVARADGLTSLQRAADFIVRHATANTVVAIDAPLVAPGASGQRACDVELARRFGPDVLHDRATSSTGSVGPAGARFVDLLRWDGFRHDPRLAEPKIQAGRWLFEVHAHAAQLVMFGLDTCVAFVAPRPPARRFVLDQLQSRLQSLQHGAPRLLMTPALRELLADDVAQLRGRRQIERHRANLDALTCAYLGAHGWRWGLERNEMIGTLDAGYVIIPTVPHTPVIDGRPLAGTRWIGLENGLNGEH